jgi:hypothetical protein
MARRMYLRPLFRTTWESDCCLPVDSPDGEGAGATPFTGRIGYWSLHGSVAAPR